MRWEKAEGLLRLARSLSASAEGLTLDEMAAEMGVGRRTAERMRDAIERVFSPLDRIGEGRRVRFRLRSQGLGALLAVPTAQELAELESAARRLSGVRADLLHSLARKIGVALREAERRRLAPDVEALIHAEALARQVGPRPRPDVTLLGPLREALLAAKIVQIEYRGERKPPRRRTVVPFGLLFGARTYLVGALKGKSEPVLWRLDRIADLVVTPEPGTPPADFDIERFAALSFGTYHEDPADVELRFAAKAAGDARQFQFHPTQMLHEEADGSLTVRFRAGGFLEMVHHLFSWGDAVTIVAPRKLHDLMRRNLETALAHHASKPFSGASTPAS